MVNINLKLPDYFYQTETRDGFHISKKMKEIWAIQLDMINEFDLICKQNNIKYFLCGGSLLGAVRHNGYIPWDDDIDIILFREEYNKLLQIAPTSFKHPYFFQNAYTDRGYSHGHSQLRRSDTCAILRSDLDRNMASFNMGIFIDIFVFDYVPQNLRERSAFLEELNSYKKIINNIGNWKFLFHTHNIFMNIVEPIRYIIKRLQYGSLKKTFERFEECAQRYRKTQDVQNIMFVDKYSFKSEWFDEYIILPFENLSLPAPKRFHEVLSAQYGSDYMIPKKMNGYHGDLFFDVNKSYKYYIQFYKKNGKLPVQ